MRNTGVPVLAGPRRRGQTPRRPEECPVILVTGATGRVGYRLMEALADAGAEATAMVRVEANGADLPGSAKHIVATFDYPPPAGVLQSFDRGFLLSRKKTRLNSSHLGI